MNSATVTALEPDGLPQLDPLESGRVRQDPPGGDAQPSQALQRHRFTLSPRSVGYTPLRRDPKHVDPPV